MIDYNKDNEWKKHLDEGSPEDKQVKTPRPPKYVSNPQQRAILNGN